MLGVLGVIVFAGLLAAQAVVVERSATVRAYPAVANVAVVTTASVVVGDTTRFVAIGHDHQGNRLRGAYTWAVLDSLGRPDTTVFVIRSTDDSSALVFAKRAGVARVKAIFLAQ